MITDNGDGTFDIAFDTENIEDDETITITVSDGEITEDIDVVINDNAGLVDDHTFTTAIDTSDVSALTITLKN